MYHWCQLSKSVLREPVATTYSATSGTSTSSVVCTGLDSSHKTQQDYYKGWTLYNTTRSATAIVDSYDASTTTLTLDRAITSQASGDTFYLTRRELTVMMRPTPLTVQAFILTYIKDPTYFQNDTDFETEIDEACEEILIYRGIAEYYLAKDASKASGFIQLANETLENLRELNEASLNQTLVFGGGDKWAVDYAWDKTYTISGF